MLQAFKATYHCQGRQMEAKDREGHWEILQINGCVKEEASRDPSIKGALRSLPTVIKENIQFKVAHIIRLTCGPVWIFKEDH